MKFKLYILLFLSVCDGLYAMETNELQSVVRVPQASPITPQEMYEYLVAELNKKNIEDQLLRQILLRDIATISGYSPESARKNHAGDDREYHEAISKELDHHDEFGFIGGLHPEEVVDSVTVSTDNSDDEYGSIYLH